MKALEKDRGRRYETASGFASDVQRYLADEQVLACPPSPTYRFRKFVRRNRGPVAAAAIVLFTLVAGIAGTSFGLVRAERARRALAERAEGERQAKQLAQEREADAKEREAETAAVLYFVENHIVAAARPEGWSGGLGHDVTLRRAIEAAIPSIEQGLADRPLIEARLRRTLGDLFGTLGESKKAAEQYGRSLALYTKHRGPNHPDTMQSKFDVGRNHSSLGRHAEAMTILEEVLGYYKAQLGPDHVRTLICMNALAGCYAGLGRHAEALKLREETLARHKATLGQNDGNTLISMMNLAALYAELGRDDDALKLYEETLPLMIAKLGSNHPTTLICKNNLAIRYTLVKRHSEAVKLLEEMLVPARAKLGPDHPSTLNYMKNVAVSYGELGRHSDAIKLLEETLALMKTKFGPDDPRTLSCRSSLSIAYSRAGQYAEAARVSEESLSLRKAKLGPDHRDVIGTMKSLVGSYTALGRHAEALRLREEVLTHLKAKLGPKHPDTAASLNSLAWTLATNPDPAIRNAARAVNLAQEAVEASPRDASFRDTLGVAQYRAGSWTEAVASLQKCRELRTGDAESSNPFFLAMAHWQLGDKEEARRWYEIATTWMDKNAPDNESLIRFRSEAAELLGVDDRSRRAPSTAPTTATSQPPKE